MTFFIAATNTDVGKTFTTLGLMEAFHAMGYRVGAFKPIETGVETRPLDGTALYEKAISLNSGFGNLTLEDVVPVRYTLPAAPFIAKTGVIPWEHIHERFEVVKNACDVLFIEGAGGVLTDTHMIIDYATLFDAHTLLVAPDGLGSISETLSALELLAHRKLPHHWAVNRQHPDNGFERITAPYYDAVFGHYFTLPADFSPLAKAMRDAAA